jgi:hypothetical protein
VSGREQAASVQRRRRGRRGIRVGLRGVRGCLFPAAPAGVYSRRRTDASAEGAGRGEFAINAGLPTAEINCHLGLLPAPHRLPQPPRPASPSGRAEGDFVPQDLQHQDLIELSPSPVSDFQEGQSVEEPLLYQALE